MSNAGIILFIISGFCVMMTVLQTIIRKSVFMGYPLLALVFSILGVLNR